MKLFELAMLLCFGASWPMSIYRSYCSRTTGGKSIFFLWLVLFGYFSGILYKTSTGFDYVSYFYIANTLMVMADIALYYRNRRLDRENLSDKPEVTL